MKKSKSATASTGRLTRNASGAQTISPLNVFTCTTAIDLLFQRDFTKTKKKNKPALVGSLCIFACSL